MLVTFAEDGRVEFTRNPTLLSLFPDDPKRIERMTDIRFDEEWQKYYILFLLGPVEYAGRQLRIDLPRFDEFMEEYGGLDVPWSMRDQILLFDTYEDAVKAEVRFVEFLRDLGFSMHGRRT